MNANKETATMENMKVRLSILWIFVMFNMVFADIVGFMDPGALEDIMTGNTGIEITQGLLLVFSILLEIPIAMIVLSRVLGYRINRWANMIAAVITILFVVGGGSTSLSYMFFAAVEVLCMLLIIWYAWTWPNPEA